MQVNLIKEAEFDFNAEKYSNIPFNTFTNLIELKPDEVKSKNNNLLQVQLFENVAEFKKCYQPGVYDETKGVHVTNKGQIFLFLKQSQATTATAQPVDKSTDANSKATAAPATDEPTNPKENTAKKA